MASAIKRTFTHNKTADINDKNCSLFTVLTATHQKRKKSKRWKAYKLLSITLTYRLRDGE